MSVTTNFKMSELENMTVERIDELLKAENDSVCKLLRMAAEHLYEIRRLKTVSQMPLSAKRVNEERTYILSLAQRCY